MNLLVIAFGLIWILLSALAIKINLKTFQRVGNLTPIPNPDPRFLGIIRNDYQQWNRKLILFGSFAFFPMKFLLLGNFVVGALLIALAISFTPRIISQKIQKFMFLYFNTYGKLMSCLAMNIQQHFASQTIKTPIVICNHQNWFDTFYITLRYSPISFVAKYEIQFWPVIGPIAKAMGCIFVKRDSENGREQTKQMIQQRIQDFYARKPGAYPLAIFCEGTTSDNKVLLKFKKGAFENLSAVTALCLNYQCKNFVMGEDEITQAEHIFTALSQSPVLKVKRVEIHPYQGEQVQQYMERCRQIMAKTWNFKLSEAGYRDVRALAQLRKSEKKNK